MVRKTGLVAAWTLATVVSVFIAAQAVGGVRDRVTDRPADLPDAAALAIVTTSPRGVERVPIVPTSSSSVAPVAAPTTVGPGTDPVATSQPPPTTTAVAPPSTESPEPSSSEDRPTTTATTTTTTTTTVPPTTEAPLEHGHYDLTGGFVEISYRPGEVYLVGATPEPGYRVSVYSSGPERVEVEFEPLDESDPYEGEFEAEWHEGQLDVEIDETFDEDD